ncbi:MAG: tail protein X [Georgfuchsia sp.]
MIVTSHQGDTVDLICQRHLRRTDIVVDVLEANPGLAAFGPILPMGTPVTLPDAAPPAASTELIQLWD